jgi:hypothetical protein
LSATLQHKRVPLVKRVEYIIDLLETVKAGYSREAADARLAERKRSFEVEKARALGRGNPFRARLSKATRLAEFCEMMCRQTGLVDSSTGTYRLTEKGELLLSMSSEGTETDALLLDSLLRTYTSFQQVIGAINDAEGGEAILPSTKLRNMYSEYASRSNITVDMWTFDIVRDLASQLGVLNWFPDSTSGQRMQRVYMASKIGYQESRTGNAGFPLHTVIAGKEAVIDRNIPDFTLFKDRVWNEYLITTNYVPRRPVFYSNLRTKVCYGLRIADKIFDRLAGKLMERDDKYLLLAAGGSLPYSRDSAGLLKSLPPKTSRGQYMVYLKMDKRSTHD